MRNSGLILWAVLLVSSCNNSYEHHATDHRQGILATGTGVSGISQPSPPSPIPPSVTSPPPPSSPTPPSVTSPPPPEVQATPLPAYYYEWKRDEFLKVNSLFLSRYDFLHRCVFPIEKHHKKGTVLDELFAVRGLINRYYLFNGEVVDIDPRNFEKSNDNFDAHYEYMTNSDSYLQKLRSFTTDTDGKLKHKAYRTWTEEEYSKLLHNHHKRGPRYGINWQVLSDNVPRDYRVRYTDAGSPASEVAHGSKKMKRGDRLLQVNGKDFVNSVDNRDVQSMIDSLEPTSTGDTLRLVLYDNDTKLKKTVTLRGVPIQPESIQHRNLLTTYNGNVGYFHVGTLGTHANDYNDVIKRFKEQEVKDVIIDFRYFNDSEGYNYDNSRNEAALAFMIAGRKKTEGKNYRITKNVTVNNHKYTHPWSNRTEVPFHRLCIANDNLRSDLGKCEQATELGWYFGWGAGAGLSFILLESLNLERVFVLASRETCNKAETFINGLRGVGVEVILIGERTCGQPFLHANLQNCGIRIEIPNSKLANDKAFGEYEDGFKPINSPDNKGISLPGCYVKDDLSKPLGDEEEPLLAAALQYRKDKTCPPVP